MKWTIRTLVASFLVMALAVSVPAVVSAQETADSSADTTQEADPNPSIADNVCRGVLATQGTATEQTTIDDCKEREGSETFGSVIRRIINIFSIVVGAVSVIMIIIGGFRYIISGGDSTGVQGAKNTILYAIVGLVIVLFAQIIVQFVVGNISNVNNTSTSQQQNQ